MSRGTAILAAALALALVSAAIVGTFWILRQPAPEAITDSIPFMNGSEVPLDEFEALDPQAEPEEPEAAEVGGHIQVKLYVVARSGWKLATESEEIPLESSVQQQASEVVELLLRLSAAFPRDVKLREIFITSQGVAYVDLSQELISNHPGGSSAEELTVFSLTSTLIANFPAIKTVKFLVEGREIQTIAGHMDLTLPYGRAPAYLEPDSERTDTSNEAS